MDLFIQVPLYYENKFEKYLIQHSWFNKIFNINPPVALVCSFLFMRNWNLAPYRVLKSCCWNFPTQSEHWERVFCFVLFCFLFVVVVVFLVSTAWQTLQKYDILIGWRLARGVCSGVGAVCGCTPSPKKVLKMAGKKMTNSRKYHTVCKWVSVKTDKF